jgi:hypothetical protein
MIDRKENLIRSDPDQLLLGPNSLLPHRFDAAKELVQALAVNRVEAHGASLFHRYKPGILENGQVLGYRRLIGVHQLGHLTHAKVLFKKCVE